MGSKIKLSWMEFSGSLGDLGLFIPLVVAMTVACDLNFGMVLILAGIMNVITGLLFRQPIPVQPMKAIAAVVITEGLVYDELIAAGLIIGVFILLISGIIDKISRYVPKSVVRGIQLGIGLRLAATGIQSINQLSLFGWDSVILAVVIFVALLVFVNRRQPILLYIFLFGFICLYFNSPSVYSTVSLTFPDIYLYWPTQAAWSGGFLRGALPQIPLTVLNSVIALCALSSQYFPGKGVEHRKVAVSVGLMNLFCVPLGGIPMCHGAGGLAAQYRFGARTGQSVIILGTLKIFVGFLFGGALLGLIQNYPMAILGPMLIFAGIELSRSIKDIIGNKSSLITAIITALFILGTTTLVGFLVGFGVSTLFTQQSGGKNDA